MSDTPQSPAPAPERSVKVGDIIQIGYRLLGVEEVQWGTHQVVDYIGLDGTPRYRPREAKVDKYANIWRFPVDPRDEVIRDLKWYANPKAGKEAIKRLLAGEE